ncbi:MAG TPA: RES family NAD+ phosphorylase [Candidatus Limnocylindrales bacterium]|nr:RES family NAD+ phosphorylase [Candidatus Limnocylindrales bacterium]
MTSEPERVGHRGPAFRCVPENGPVELDALVSADGENDRWNRPGQPTLYLALDPGVALAEAGRHQPPSDENGPACQRLLRLDVVAADLVDLRDPASLAALGIDGAPCAFLVRERARGLASRLRSRSASVAGLIVPSAAFLDDPSRGNLVLFMERAGEVSDVVRSWRQVGRLAVAGA